MRAFGVLFLLGSIPISTLADRHPRKIIAGVSMAIWSVMVFATGFVQSVFWFFLARMGVGISQSYALPVNAPLLADRYPIQARSRVFALYGGMETIGRVAGPMIAGGIAGAIAGPASWRWVFVIIAFTGIPVAIVTFLLKEPRRGRNEMEAVLGGELAEDEAELPISISVAFERLRKIRSFYFFLVGLAALGFALFSLPLFINLILKDTYGLNAWHRGIFGSAVALPAIAALAIAAPRSDALFRRSPPAALVFVGAMIGISGLVTIIGLYMPNVWILGVFFALGGAISQAAFVSIVAVVNAVIPYRLRSRGTAMVGVYVSLFGGFFGAVLTGMLADAFGPRAALTVVVVPASIVGGVLIAYGARFVRGDISRCVEELLEEKAEADRVSGSGGGRGRDPGPEPRLLVRNRPGAVRREPRRAQGRDRRPARHQRCGQVDAAAGHQRARCGQQGSGAVPRSDHHVRRSRGPVEDRDRAAHGRQRRLQHAHRRGEPADGGVPLRRPRGAAPGRGRPGAVPRSSADRRRMRAGDLSGGQQQMLALAMALVHDPEVLIIDELSLGLAPVTVQGLLEIVRELKEQGMTMIIVEQSLNVALAIADRAIFMEKGQIRFDGPAAELAERDDLARAVFLGAEA